MLTQWPDPRKMQISLTGFLEKRAAPFMNELWHHLVSAQASVGGVPRAFVEQKKREMQAMRDETTSLAQRVRLPSRDERGPPSSRRWDRGRSPVRNRPRHGDAHEFVDKRGNVTRRERDAGWVGARHLPQGPRAGRAPTEDPRDTYDEFGRDTAYRRAHERHTHGYADERSRDARREGDIWSSPASRSYRDGRHHSTYRDETPPPGPGRRRDEARSPLPAGAATPVYTRGDTTPVYPRGDATPRYERGDTTPRYARDDSPQYSPPPP